MGSRAKIIIAIVTAAAFLLQLLFLNTQFAATMPLHIAVHMPLIVILGVILGTTIGIKIKYPLAALIFVMSSFALYMLPRTVDLSAINLTINIVRQLHLFLCGILIALALPSAIFEIRIAFLGMLASTTAASAMAMRQFNILVCSAFTIPQQQKTGTWLLYLSAAIFIFTLYKLFKSLISK